MTGLSFSLDPPRESEDIETARKLFAGPCDFLKGVVKIDSLPAPDRGEVCFAGRSNVGKSSLINALTGRKGLARASNTPGRTQEINYFALGQTGYLVDLPGYGFAEAPKKKVEAWQDLIRQYLAGRVTLNRAILLIDARHGIKPVDHEYMTLLDRAAVVFLTVLTKTDKPKKGALEKTIAQVEAELQKHPAAYPEILTTSSETGQGISELRAAIAGLLTA
ncbi:MAG: ribosome biogenesis GTP-binding protein YihA/YsxC [Pseudomonadota bacterium]